MTAARVKPQATASPVLVGTALLLTILLAGCAGEFPDDDAHHRAAAAAYDGERLARSLQDIEAWHVENGTGLAAVLNEGVPLSSIETAFAGRECRPSQELQALWSWRNGGQGPAPLVWYHDFLSMQEALSEYDQLTLDPLVQWDPDYVPVFVFEGEWYASYCGPRSGTSGPVVHFFLEDEPRVTHVNLTTFLATMAEALHSGAVKWNNDAMVEDVHRVYLIHQKHNPGYAFPYHVPGGD